MHAKVIRWSYLETPDHPQVAEKTGLLVSTRGSTALAVPLPSATGEPFYQAFFASRAGSDSIDFPASSLRAAARLGIQLPGVFETVCMTRVEAELTGSLLNNALLAGSILDASDNVAAILRESSNPGC